MKKTIPVLIHGICLALVATHGKGAELATILPADEVAVHETANRYSVCLNTQWSFQPASAQTRSQPPTNDWQKLSVPGLWNSKDTAVTNPDGSVTDCTAVAFGWFERMADVPAKMRDKRITLEIKEVSGWAKVFVDGQEMGVVDGKGQVDLTGHIRVGTPIRLSILVAAIYPGKVQLPHTIFDGPVDMPTTRKFRGILGDVFLEAEPSGPRIRHLTIRTSVKDWSWNVIASTENLKLGASYTVEVEAQDAKHVTVASMKKTIVADGTNAQASVNGAWQQPHLWELNDPYLHTCVARLYDKTGALLDECMDTFGFREFRIEKEDFFLNGRKLRLRPQLILGNSEPLRQFCPPLIRSQFLGIKAEGFNIAEIWPNYVCAQLVNLAAEADRVGLLLMLPLESMVFQAPDFQKNGKVSDTWRDRVAEQIAAVENHPSVAIWTTSPHKFGTPDPPFFTRDALPSQDWMIPSREGATLAKESIHQIDPTHPVVFHASDIGDICAPNIYLNMMPLQERKDLLEVWAARKDFPLMFIEFGLPFTPSNMRYRRVGMSHFEDAPYMTEAAAVYLGKEAYTLERDEYIHKIENKFYGNEAYQSWQSGDEPSTEPNFSQVVALFVKETWRSYRTWGITGGMLPWEYWTHSYNRGWQPAPVSNDTIKIGAHSVPGCWPDSTPQGSLMPWTVARMDSPVKCLTERSPPGLAFEANNHPFLAYVGGPDTNHTSMAHNFYASDELRRDVISIYDGDDSRDREANLEWTVRLGGEQIASAQKNIQQPSGMDLRQPIRLKLPAVNKRTEGVVELKVDGKTVDNYEFTVFPRVPSPKLRRKVAIWDPRGLSSAMLDKLNVPHEAFKGGSGKDSILVIGREGLSGRQRPGLDLAKAVRNGLKVIVCAQTTAFWEDQMGWRTSWHVSRRFWPTEGDAAKLFAPLKDTDLADWAGTGTLLPTHYEYPKGKYSWQGFGEFPPLQPVWHCGNRGSVASVALEIPHYGSFTPLLQGEFDLAFSPLLELRAGQGAVYVVQLDLEDQCGKDPAADYVLAAILKLADQETPTRASKLMVYNNNSAECLKHLAAGGNVLVAWHSDAGALSAAAKGLNINLKISKAHLRSGGVELPAWNELRGVSVADLHWRGFLDVPVIVSMEGGETCGNGLLARKQMGQGTVVFCQIDPSMFPTAAQRASLQRPNDFGKKTELLDDKTYFRKSRWHAVRLLSELKTNLGGEETPQDAAFLDALLAAPRNPKLVDLLGEGWKTREDVEKTAGEREGWFQTDLDETTWQDVRVPVSIPHDRGFTAWFRRRFALPETMRQQPLALRFTAVADEMPFVYLNGHELTHAVETRSSFARQRLYFIPPDWLTEKNLVAVKLYEFSGQSGLRGAPLQIEAVASPWIYYPDYDPDDNPFRWYPW